MGFHGINVVGTNDHGMAVVAANAIAEAGGGEVVVSDVKILSLLELALGGVLPADTLENSLKKSKAVADLKPSLFYTFIRNSHFG